MLSRTLKHVFYAFTVPLMILAPFSLRHPKMVYVPLVTLGLLAILAFVLSGGLRVRLQRWNENSRVPRLLDSAVWIGVTSILALEGTLFFVDLALDSPLFALPRASARAQIDNNRRAPHQELVDGSRTNRHGFNDLDWNEVKEPRTFRVAALGDSFAHGIVGYQKNFLTLLESELGEMKVSPDEEEFKVDVLNFGVPNIGPDGYRVLLEQQALRFDPDVILVCLFTGNDFIHLDPHTWFRASNWRLYGFIQRALRIMAENRRVEASTQGSTDPAQPPPKQRRLERAEETPSFSVEAYERLARTYLDLVDPAKEKECARRVRETFEALEDIVALAAPKPVLIAVIPSELQVNAELRARICEISSLDESSLDLDRPYALVREHFDPMPGVQVLDLRTSLVAAESEGRTYRPRDSHWNIRGNEVVAKALAPWIRATLSELR